MNLASKASFATTSQSNKYFLYEAYGEIGQSVAPEEGCIREAQINSELVFWGCRRCKEFVGDLRLEEFPEQDGQALHVEGRGSQGPA